MLVTVDLNSNSDGKPTIDLVGNPPTRARGMDLERVDKDQSVSLPQHTLLITHAGFKTLDNHYPPHYYLHHHN
jgi:hypothetical protein